MSTVKYQLDEEAIPRQWYNVAADVPEAVSPPLDPATGQPIGPEALSAIFPMALLEQEMTAQKWVEIPDPVREVYRLWRPTPLFRARALEKRLDTPAHIYYKYEGVSPPGSHKPNTAVAQAFYNQQAGIKNLSTETGAGQWGSALAFATNLFGLGCTVFMVRCSYHQKPFRKTLMNIWGATVHPSPTNMTEAGKQVLAEHPNTSGSLGIAISEAVEVAAKSDDTNYSLGSVLNHVLLHQTVIGLEARRQMELAGEAPDVVIGCAGGGSNFAGLAFPFVPDKKAGADMRILATEPTACPTMTKGAYAYDFGDTAQTTPLLRMHTLGHDFVPPAIHAGGLRYHGMAPLVSGLIEQGLVESLAINQLAIFQGAQTFARSEGIIPAPESAHAVQAAIDEAVAAKEAGQKKVILFNLSGHGHLDLGAYEAYFDGELQDYEYPTEAIDDALSRLPKVPG